MKSIWIGAAVGLSIALGAGVPALAHHSFAMFDRNKELTLIGTVKEFQWTNPHIWIQVVVPNKRGGADEWSVEGASPNGLKRQGWTRTSLKVGDRVQVKIHPLKSGEKGGSFLSMVLPDGRFLGERQSTYR